MKIIEPYFEFIDEPARMKKIELCGRVCYKSESKITADSAETFVKNLIRRGHESVLEHADVIIEIIDNADVKKYNEINTEIYNRYGWVNMLRMTNQNGRYIISGNVRMWRDFMRRISAAVVFYPLDLFRGILFDDVNKSPSNIRTSARIITSDQLRTDDEINTHKTQTVKFVVDRGISHEIVRHRTASFSQESTRYCNYIGDVTFIKPPFFDGLNALRWIDTMQFAEEVYNLLIAKGAKPQEARAVLPNSTKTEIIMTANVECWKHFFELRTAAGAHPQMRQIAEPLKAEFIERGIL